MGVRQRVGWLGGILLFAVAAACGDEDASSAGQADDVVPFEPRPAEEPMIRPEEEVAAPDLPECTAEMVSFDVVTDAEVVGGDPGDLGVLSAENRNLALMARPGESCGLSAWPMVSLVTDDGHREELVPEPSATPPRTDRLLLTGLQRVVGIVRWQSWCGPAGVEVRAEGRLAGGTVSTPLPDPPSCDPAGQNTAGFWMTFPAQPPESPLVVELVEVPPRAPFDGTLRTVVELRNTGDEALSLDPCPVHRQSFGESGTGVFATNELNCPPAPEEIPAGGRLRFAAELELPAEEIPSGFGGTFTIAVYIDEGHQPAYASTELQTATSAPRTQVSSVRAAPPAGLLLGWPLTRASTPTPSTPAPPE